MHISCGRLNLVDWSGIPIYTNIALSIQSTIGCSSLYGEHLDRPLLFVLYQCKRSHQRWIYNRTPHQQKFLILYSLFRHLLTILPADSIESDHCGNILTCYKLESEYLSRPGRMQNLHAIQDAFLQWNQWLSDPGSDIQATAGSQPGSSLHSFSGL